MNYLVIICRCCVGLEKDFGCLSVHDLNIAQKSNSWEATSALSSKTIRLYSSCQYHIDMCIFFVSKKKNKLINKVIEINQ